MTCVSDSQAADAVLLIPFKQTVYARTYMMVDGKKFYVFTDKSIDPAGQS